MLDSISSLVTLMAPPKSPVDAIGDWGEVERRVGTRLPDDYKEFISLYGNVLLFNWIRLFAPFSYDTASWARFYSQCAKRVELCRSIIDDGVPYPVFPDAGGLLPIGTTDNGEFIYWITVGEPNQWGIYFLDPRGFKGYSMPDTTLVRLLVELADLTSPLFPYTAPTEFCSERSVVVIPRRT